MDKDVYIKHLEEENRRLRKRIEELERLLGMNSKNSSKPPSSDPPTTSAVLPKRRHNKRGAKNGHQPHLRALLPPEKVTHRMELKPHLYWFSVNWTNPLRN
jgi:transposase